MPSLLRRARHAAATHAPPLHMRWQRLCFLHWEVPASALQRTLPKGLEVDTFQGKAYLGVVPLLMRDVVPHPLPPMPWLSHFPELNLRTYVTGRDGPAVWFYSLDAAQPVAVALAQTGFGLPYRHANMHHWARGEGNLFYSQRRGTGEEFAATYAPASAPFQAERGTLEDFLTGRDRLYSVLGGQLCSARVRHAPWPLQRAHADVRANTLAKGLGVSLSGQPHLLYSADIEVRTSGLRRVCPPYTENGEPA